MTDSPDTWVRNALLLDRQGRIFEAMGAYEQLLQRWPDLPDCWYNLAVLQRRTRQFDAALASYQQALDRGIKEPEEVYLNRGVIFSDYLRQDEAAERELNAALVHNPDYVPALMNLANLHEDLGRRELAMQIYERLLLRDPHAADPLARYARLRTFTDLGDPIIARLRQAIARPGLSLEDRASLEFSLGRALDACGSYAEAFARYSAANRDSRESAPPGTGRYDRTLAERYTQRLIAAFPTAGRAVRAPMAVAESLPSPIFICGMFRSGSTLTEQLLAGHPLVTAGGELDFLPHAVQTDLAPYPETMAAVLPQRLVSLAAEYRKMLHQRFTQAVNVTDKRTENYQHIGLIKTLFPTAKILVTTRNTLDNCLAIYFLHLDQRMSYALDLMDIGHHVRQYQQLMEHWKRLYGADIQDIDYDRLVQDPRPVVERMLEFLGLGWDERCLSVPSSGRSIKTESVWQVREPLYRRSSGRSRHYETELAELREYLENSAS